nr:VIT1/CCC1 transporter family protein [Bradyrhizobium nanningense]
MRSSPLSVRSRQTGQRWADFMMRFELGLERPEPKRAPIGAATIGGSHVIGGLIPLAPYMFAHDIGTALYISVAATSVALICFGAVKGHFTIEAEERVRLVQQILPADFRWTEVEKFEALDRRRSGRAFRIPRIAPGR